MLVKRGGVFWIRGLVEENIQQKEKKRRVFLSKKKGRKGRESLRENGEEEKGQRVVKETKEFVFGRFKGEKRERADFLFWQGKQKWEGRKVSDGHLGFDCHWKLFFVFLVCPLISSHLYEVVYSCLYHYLLLSSK